MDYEIVFESNRIYFVKITEKLVNDYLKMVNDIEVQNILDIIQKYILMKMR